MHSSSNLLWIVPVMIRKERTTDYNYQPSKWICNIRSHQLLLGQPSAVASFLYFAAFNRFAVASSRRNLFSRIHCCRGRSRNSYQRSSQGPSRISSLTFEACSHFVVCLNATLL
jgi:hypothetical protein